MKISNDVATFTPQEKKIILGALKVQTYVKSNSGGDQKSLDTPGITAIDDLAQQINKHSNVRLTDARDLDSPDYAHDLLDDLHYYLIYKNSLSLLKPQVKKTCEKISKQLKSNITARQK